jgi:beta-phosphoglucomutase-like phosphatase (HAD superfamily)
MHTVTLVILDCDGVLVDGELIAHGIYARQFSSIGFPLTTTECLQRFSGTCEQDMVEEVEREQGLTLSPDFKQALHESVLEAFKTQLQPMPGVGAFLRTLRDSNIQFCVATNGKPDRVRYALTHTNLIEYFPPPTDF